MQKCFSKHSCMGTAIMKLDKETEEDIIIIILSCLTSLDSSDPIQMRISINHEGLSTPITT